MTNTYRPIKVPDPRSKGVFWWEIECMTPDGKVTTVAVCDTREECMSLLRVMRGGTK